MGRVTYLTSNGESYTAEAKAGISIMQLATSNGIPGIEAECGGVLSCATCHVYVDGNWLDKLAPPVQAELDMLAFAETPNETIRLGCQIPYHDALDGMVVRIPDAQ